MIENGSILNAVSAQLDKWDSIDLAGLDKVKLMNRVDTKKYIPANRLIELLNKIREDYFVLEVKGKRASLYDSLYFDSPDLDFYRQHHNGKTNRYKIRYRKYVSSNLTFFEVKFKSNKKRTDKTRIKVDNIPLKFGEEEKKMLVTKRLSNISKLQPIVWVHFYRITLANLDFTERVTIDLDLNYKGNNKDSKFEELAICEIKQGKRTRNSSILSAIKDLGISGFKMSKYCLGIIECFEPSKVNRFKRKLKRLQYLKDAGNY